MKSFNKLFHKNLLIILTPFLIFFGIKRIFFPINILLIIIGIFIIYIGNYNFQKTNNYIYMFELLILGPLFVIMGFTKNKHSHIKHISSILGFCMIIYYFKDILSNSFLRR